MCFSILFATYCVLLPQLPLVIDKFYRIKMSRDRRWWSVPRVLPSFNLWRTSDPTDIKGNDEEDEVKETAEETTVKEEIKKRESVVISDDDTKQEQKDETETDSVKKLIFRRSPSKRCDRSRSSSLSNCSLKSLGKKKDRSSLPPEPTTPATAEIPDLTGMPEIIFSFFNDRDDEFVIVSNSVPPDKEEKAVKKSNSEDSESSYASTTGDVIEEKNKKKSNPLERQDDCDGASLTEDLDGLCETDYRVKMCKEDSPKPERVRHVSTLTMRVKTANYCNLEKSVFKDHDYEELCEAKAEQPYSSPRNSSITITPVEIINDAVVPLYSVVDKSNKKSETTDSNAEDKNTDEVPEIPQPDWDRNSDDYNPDYAELTTPEPKETKEIKETERQEVQNSQDLPEVPIIKEGPVLKHDYEDLEYCQHRANLKTNLRRMSLMRARRSSMSIKRVRSRLGRAWKAVKGWWLEERIRLGDVILKQAHEQAVRREPSIQIPAVTEDDQTSRVASRLDDVQEENLTCTDGGSTIVPLKDEMDSDENTCDEFEFDKTSSVFSESCPTTPKNPGPVVHRRRVTSPKPALSRSSSLINFRRSRYCPEGQNGFEELRKYIKQGEDFCKDLATILQERSEAEAQYSKTLSKLSAKLLKATKEVVGTVNQAWQKVAIEMETQSEAHRSLANALSEEVVKPLRQLIESQHRVRKSVETAVDKTGKSLGEWRSAESKSKKQSFTSARENEKLQDAMLDIRLANPNNTKLSTSTLHLHSQKVVSDKENAKMESKRRKAEDSVKKADVEYYTYCIRAERARLEWESAVTRGSHCFQTLEEEKLQNLKELALCYLHHYKGLGPKLVQSSERLQEPIESCDISQDLDTIVSLKGTGQTVPEQLLPDFYAEHITLAMNKDRRRQALVKVLQLIRQDLERERRSKQGVENLARALKQTPNFGTEDSQQNVTEKLHHMRSMLTYLEAAKYKVQNALADIEGQTKSSHPLASHIQITRDRQGLQQSILKVPPWVRKESIDITDSPDWMDRGAADGNSVQPDSDFDEFSSQGSERDYQSSVISQYPVSSPTTITPRCKALYHYAANLYDELNLSPGDVINIHDKQADGWWLGELNGVIGIFPATYVEEIK
ncbi:nostrin [Lycorma delicatula]|uniref:nostrin n=1 Tax=Lycorma delicatula TaxID=130591 RepID=UPI003F50E090